MYSVGSGFGLNSWTFPRSPTCLKPQAKTSYRNSIGACLRGHIDGKCRANCFRVSILPIPLELTAVLHGRVPNSVEFPDRYKQLLWKSDRLQQEVYCQKWRSIGKGIRMWHCDGQTGGARGKKCQLVRCQDWAQLSGNERYFFPHKSKQIPSLL